MFKPSVSLMMKLSAYRGGHWRLIGQAESFDRLATIYQQHITTAGGGG